jgi:hypothetical protein
VKRVALVVLLVASRAHADEATAIAAYKQAEELAKQGKWKDACPLYEASYHADPKLGALLHAADCQEKIDHTATAWAQFNDAIELAHKTGDVKREDYARQRAAALEPKLAKLHLSPPKQLIPGLSVKRDGADITVLVGTDIPLDPGDHVITATAPGYQDFTKTVNVSTGTVSFELPVLEKQVVEPPKPVVHEGTVKITTLPNAEIMLDQEHVGTGTYEAKVKSGGHTLRIVAGGMRPYQSEIVVGDDETRTIDVPLEKEPEPVIIKPAGPPPEELPGFEAGVALGAGVKLHGDKPLVTTLRGDIAFRLGRRTNFGVFVEYGQTSMSGSCGFDMPGPMPATPYDFGVHNQFDDCQYLMPGLQLYVHARPKQQIDPYFGIAPGFRFQFASWTPYIGGVPQPSQQEVFPGIVANLRAAVDYHPRGGDDNWQVSAWVDAAVTVIGEESAKDYGYTDEGQTFVSIIGGLRTSLTW